ncbi:MAG: hypothetical protein WC608_01545 [Parcubacteria group bacterium]
MKTEVIFDKLGKIDKIRIHKFLIRSGDGFKIVDDPAEINKLIGLLQQPFEKCEVFVDSPQLRMFRVALYRKEKMVLGIPVAGNFVKKDDDWYFTTNPSLLREIINQTKGIPLKKMKVKILW